MISKYWTPWQGSTSCKITKKKILCVMLTGWISHAQCWCLHWCFQLIWFPERHLWPKQKTLEDDTPIVTEQTKTLFYKLILYVTFTITTVSFHTGVHIQHQHFSVLNGYIGYNRFCKPVNKGKRLWKMQDIDHKSIIHFQYSAIIIVSMVKLSTWEVHLRVSNVFHKVHDRIFQKEARTTHDTQK